MSAPQESYARHAIVRRVVDGDTIDLDIDLGWGVWISERVRLAGVDTPEIRGAERTAGLHVANRVQERLVLGAPCVLHSLDFGRDRYGRTVGRIYADDWCLNDWLLDARLGWPTDANGKLTVERTLELLDLP